MPSPVVDPVSSELRILARRAVFLGLFLRISRWVYTGLTYRYRYRYRPAGHLSALSTLLFGLSHVCSVRSSILFSVVLSSGSGFSGELRSAMKPADTLFLSSWLRICSDALTNSLCEHTHTRTRRAVQFYTSL